MVEACCDGIAASTIVQHLSSPRASRCAAALLSLAGAALRLRRRARLDTSLVAGALPALSDVDVPGSGHRHASSDGVLLAFAPRLGCLASLPRKVSLVAWEEEGSCPRDAAT